MERLTIDEAIKDFRYCAKQNMADLDINFAKENNQISEWLKELKAYKATNFTPEQVVEMAKELEELKKQLPPCKVGDTIYVIPSKTNYDLNILHKYYDNNRVYEQEVSEIRFYGSGYLIVTCEGMCSAVDVSYKETWFLTKAEAEAKLKEMEDK